MAANLLKRFQKFMKKASGTLVIDRQCECCLEVSKYGNDKGLKNNGVCPKCGSKPKTEDMTNGVYTHNNLTPNIFECGKDESAPVGKAYISPHLSLTAPSTPLSTRPATPSTPTYDDTSSAVALLLASPKDLVIVMDRIIMAAVGAERSGQRPPPDGTSWPPSWFGGSEDDDEEDLSEEECQELTSYLVRSHQQYQALAYRWDDDEILDKQQLFFENYKASVQTPAEAPDAPSAENKERGAESTDIAANNPDTGNSAQQANTIATIEVSDLNKIATEDEKRDMVTDITRPGQDRQHPGVANTCAQDKPAMDDGASHQEDSTSDASSGIEPTGTGESLIIQDSINAIRKALEESLRGHEGLVQRLSDPVRQHVAFVHSIPGFAGLTQTDRIKLIADSRLESGAICQSTGYNPWLRVSTLPCGRTFPQDALVSVGGKEQAQLYCQAMNAVYRLQLTREEKILFKCLAIFTPWREDVDDGSKISAIQWRMTQCLLKLLAANRRPRPNLFFSEVISAHLALQTMADGLRRWMYADPMAAYRQLAADHALVDWFACS